MQFCSNCGSKIKQVDNFCFSCGSKVDTQIIKKPPKPDNQIIPAVVLTCIGFFNSPYSLVIGIVAIIFGLLMDSDYEARKYEAAKKKAKVVKILNYCNLGILMLSMLILVGIIVSIIVIIAISIIAETANL